MMANFSVKFLSIIDAANGFWSDEVDSSIPTNVQETHNFYQENAASFDIPLTDSFIQWSRGYPATGRNVNKIKVISNSDGVEVNHTDIDETVLEMRISKNIISFIK